MTIVVKNATGVPFYVDDTGAQLGVTIARSVNGTWFDFVEVPGCCEACAGECLCGCPGGAPAPTTRRIVSGGSATRVWDGVVQVNGSRSCGGMTQSCLNPENPLADEQFRATLCGTETAPAGAVSDAGVIRADLPRTGLRCQSVTFRPLDGTVELSPPARPPCSTDAECTTPGEHCFGGGCTSACPQNSYRGLGADWQVQIPTPDNQGFFTTTVDAAGRSVSRGSGTVSTVTYQGQTTTIRLASASGPGAAYVSAPAPFGLSLVAGLQVAVTVVTPSASASSSVARGLVIRDAQGELLLAADTGIGGLALGPVDVSPMTLRRLPAALGCSELSCGKFVYNRVGVSMGGEEKVAGPGELVTFTSGASEFKFFSLSPGRFETGSCDGTQLEPFVFFRTKP